MLFLSFPALIIFIQIKIIFSNGYIVNYHSEYLSIMDDRGISQNYDLQLIYSGNIYYDMETNLIGQNNYLFYYLESGDTNWKNIISQSRNFFIIYCENIDKLGEMLQILRIKQIIIGLNSKTEEKEINLKANNNNIDSKIFISKDRDEIKNKYYRLSGKTYCSTYMYFYYSGDVYADFIVEFAFIFIMIFLFIWSFIYFKARKTGKYLFIHIYILIILIFYLFHTLLYLILVNKQKDKYFDEDIFSGALYNTYLFFQFFTKLLPALFATIQLNVFELNEHYRIIRNSKVIHILSANIFFVISLENDNQILSEVLNGFLYILILICLFYMYIQFKNCLEEKMIDAIIDDPDYTPTLQYKKKLLKIHSFCIFSYCIIYNIFIFLFRNILAEYRTIKFIIVMINYSDLFLVILLCTIHFPKELPPRYVEQIIFDDININFEENENFEKIYAYEQIEEKKYFENYKEGDSANIIIIENPFNENKILEDDEEEIEEEEEEEKKEIEEGKDTNNDKKNDINIETTKGDDSIGNKNNIKNSENNSIIIKDNNFNNDDQRINNINESNKNKEDEQKALIIKEENINNQSCIEEDNLDLYRTKLGYIEI